MINTKSFFLSLGLLTLLALPAHAQEAHEGYATRGEPKYKPGFAHFDYVNPDAPKGGELHMMALGSFSGLNPFSLMGKGADGAAGVAMVFETLMASSYDEPSSQYGWVAKSMTIAPDRTWVSFKLRPEAHFHDGSPITADDVIFSFNTLRDKGHPFYSSYYKDVTKTEKIAPDEIKFTFRNGTNIELPSILGGLPVLSQKYWQGKDFAAMNLEIILGSGPYKVSNIDPGRSITYERVKDWWAKDLPINVGRYNFDRIRYDYYRDTTVAMEAFIAGQFDERYESAAKLWALAYNVAPVQKGLINKEMIRNYIPQGMQSFLMNTRRPIFKDRRTREALNYAFDFEWTNKAVAFSAYKRLNSYFENSELAGHGMPSADELKLLEPLRGKIPDEVFTKEFRNPATDGSGNNRENLQKAAALLKEAGWTLKNGALTNAEGQILKFEILTDQAMFDRWINPWIANLNRLGVKANYRIIDPSHMQSLMNDYNYDITVVSFPGPLSPGNELRDYFGSEKADVKGGSNYIGIKDPAVDTLIDHIIQAKSREDLVTATKALDRVLVWNEYVVPNWYIDSFRVASWDLLRHWKVNPPYNLSVEDTWWIDPAKEPKIRAAQNRK